MLGRDSEWSTLEAFANPQSGFRWLQIAGEAGQGKSRLALELLGLLSPETWNRGFASDQSLRELKLNLPEWRPVRPTLIIIDHVMGREALIGDIMGSLAENSENFQHAVLVLLVERQSWLKGGWRSSLKDSDSYSKQGKVFQSDARSEWFENLNVHSYHDLGALEFRFAEGVIELKGLSDTDLFSVIEQYSGLGTNELSQGILPNRLREIDPDGRPLYACFLADALVAGTFDPGWSRAELLDDVLDREHIKHWRHAFGSVQTDGQVEIQDVPQVSVSKRLAALASITGGFSTLELEEVMGWEEVDQASFRKALVFNGNPREVIRDQTQQIVMPMEPDLLAEWAVLRWLHREIDRHLVIGTAWFVRPTETATFLYRLARDFPEHSGTLDLLSVFPLDLGFPRTEKLIAAAAFGGVSVRIVTSMMDRQFHDPPEALISGLRFGSSANAPIGTFTLGQCYALGCGVEQDSSRALVLLTQAAQNDHVPALLSLAACYEMGVFVDRSDKDAANFYSRAVLQGSSRAMVWMGSYVSSAHAGKPANPALAKELSEDAAKLGCGDGYANIGLFHERGLLGEPSFAEALPYYEKAVSLGSAFAHLRMALRPDAERQSPGAVKAKIEHLEAAAELGFGYAMGCLALEYLAYDDEQSFSLALDWAEKGASYGSRFSMYLYGLTLASGYEGPTKSKEAMFWLLRAAKAGDDAASKCLSRYGLGPEFVSSHSRSSLEVPYDWYKVLKDEAGNPAFRIPLTSFAGSAFTTD